MGRVFGGKRLGGRNGVFGRALKSCRGFGESEVSR